MLDPLLFCLSSATYPGFSSRASPSASLYQGRTFPLFPERILLIRLFRRNFFIAPPLLSPTIDRYILRQAPRHCFWGLRDSTPLPFVRVARFPVHRLLKFGISFVRFLLLNSLCPPDIFRPSNPPRLLLLILQLGFPPSLLGEVSGAVSLHAKSGFPHPGTPSSHYGNGKRLRRDLTLRSMASLKGRFLFRNPAPPSSRKTPPNVPSFFPFPGQRLPPLIEKIGGLFSSQERLSSF